MNKKVVLFLLLLVVAPFSNCGGWKGLNGIFDVTESSSASSPYGNEPITPVHGALTAAIPNFTQIDTSLKNLTCVTTPPGTILNASALMRNVYSQTGSANSMSQTVQAVNIRISSLYCDEAFSREQSMAANQRCVYGSINPLAGPEQFNPTVIRSFASALANRFWGTTVSNEEIDIFAQGILDILNASTSTGTQSTRNIAVSSCTLALNVLNGLLM